MRELMSIREVTEVMKEFFTRKTMVFAMRAVAVWAAAAGLAFLSAAPMRAQQAGAAHPCLVRKDADGLRKALPACWYEKAAGIKVVTFKKNLHYGFELSLKPDMLSKELDQIRHEGFSAIEIFAPAEGLQAYNGLDIENFFRIDPELGTMADFRRAVHLAHEKKLAVIVFLNIGYFSVEAPDWKQAEREKRAGLHEGKVNWFLWSDRPDAPAPPAEEDMYVTPQQREKYKDYWGWHYCRAANAYFWSRWKANAPDGTVIPLPELNWGDAGWRQEAKGIVTFWMDTGIDGMLIDAASCDPYLTWGFNRTDITDIISSYGNTLIDPEGGRGTEWITEAGYNTLHDYGMDYSRAVETGDPEKLEAELNRYHDHVVEFGGQLYTAHWSNKFPDNPAKRHLEQALLVGVGGIVVYTKGEGNPDEEEARNLRLKRAHSALQSTALRSALKTNADNKYYAVLKTARNRSERMVAVYNFQSSPQTVEVELGVLDTRGLVDAETGQVIPAPDQFHPVAVKLPAYGYRFFTVLPRR